MYSNKADNLTWSPCIPYLGLFDNLWGHLLHGKRSKTQALFFQPHCSFSLLCPNQIWQHTHTVDQLKDISCLWTWLFCHCCQRVCTLDSIPAIKLRKWGSAVILSDTSQTTQRLCHPAMVWKMVFGLCAETADSRMRLLLAGCTATDQLRKDKLFTKKPTPSAGFNHNSLLASPYMAFTPTRSYTQQHGNK